MKITKVKIKPYRLNRFIILPKVGILFYTQQEFTHPFLHGTNSLFLIFSI